MFKTYLLNGRMGLTLFSTLALKSLLAQKRASPLLPLGLAPQWRLVFLSEAFTWMTAQTQGQGNRERDSSPLTKPEGKNKAETQVLEGAPAQLPVWARPAGGHLRGGMPSALDLSKARGR